jgi:hypothetical protein
MNEKIKLLAEQATSYYHGGLGTEIEVFDKEKFAELIVKEYLAGFETEIADLKERLNSYERKD